MPPFDPSLCTLAAAKDACDGIDGDSQDDLLRRLILAATGTAESLTRPNLKSRIYSDTDVAAAAPALVLDGSGRRWIDLPYWPVTAVAKVEFLTTDQPETWTAVDLATFPCRIDAQVPGRIFFRSVVFPYWHQSVRVSFTAGFTAVPEKLANAVAMIVAHRYRQPDRQAAGVASRTFDKLTTVYLNEELPKAALADLRDYAQIAV